jgi:hypothetical protein
MKGVRVPRESIHTSPQLHEKLTPAKIEEPGAVTVHVPRAFGVANTFSNAKGSQFQPGYFKP